jgi:hypothetical protein
MFNRLRNLINLSIQLFPTGRAFRIPKNGIREKINNADRQQDEYILNSAIRILDSILPDNPNFTTDDATRWEQRLGMIVNEDLDLETRKIAIRRKMNHPGTILARQSAGYIQDQLRAVGFDVYVYENPNEINPLVYFGVPTSGIAIHATDVYHMATDLYHGDTFLWDDVVANNIDYTKDAFFDVGLNLRCTFFICGATEGIFANVEAIRREEFRQLILKVKPTQTIAYLGINYI